MEVRSHDAGTERGVRQDVACCTENRGAGKNVTLRQSHIDTNKRVGGLVVLAKSVTYVWPAGGNGKTFWNGSQCRRVDSSEISRREKLLRIIVGNKERDNCDYFRYLERFLCKTGN